MRDVLAYGRGIGTRLFSRSLPVQTILGFFTGVGFGETTMEKGIVRVERDEGTESWSGGPVG